jgi:ketosteroid isomerase-like protein
MPALRARSRHAARYGLRPADPVMARYCVSDVAGARLVQDWLDTFDNFRAEPVELIDAGEDQVVAVLRLGGRAKLSGVETQLTYAVVYTIRDGKIARGREYAARDDAVEAAGLSE